jgi:hypothetical protein
MLGERRGAVYASSAIHIQGGGLLGVLDLDRGPSCGGVHVMAAALASALGDRVLLGVLLRERAPPRGGVQVMARVKSGVGDLELAAAPSSVAFWSAMGFTGGHALLNICMTNKGLALDFGSAPGRLR